MAREGELRTRVTPPVGYNAQVTDIQPKTAANVTPGSGGGTFTGLIDPNSNPTTLYWPMPTLRVLGYLNSAKHLMMVEMRYKMPPLIT
ncbi:MAG: hypothetical protein IPN94_23885 [Sphingobacteriales bacterium]|nr:hypothetical protein [Sphingobacteriales bacterium]